jgi:preprotein translocase subunit SecE
MAGAKETVLKVKLFFEEVIGEVKKSTWPTKDELIESTVVVVMAILILSVFVGVSDKVLVILVGWLMS